MLEKALLYGDFERIRQFFPLKGTLGVVTPLFVLQLFEDFMFEGLPAAIASKNREYLESVIDAGFSYFVRTKAGLPKDHRVREQIFYSWLLSEYRRDYTELWDLFEKRIRKNCPA